MKAQEKKSKDVLPTRERILDGALKLFNEKGESGVTTAQVAEFLGISEGNLWYHFRTKREIVFELNRRLEAEIDKNLSRLPDENVDLKDFLRYAARAFEYLWEYRFLFRDRFDRAKDEDALIRLQELTGRGQKNVELILDDMRRREMLALSTDETRALAINAWIIHSNWLRFLQIRENVQEIKENHIKEGFAQIISLFNPYLSEEGKREAAGFISAFSLKQLNAESGKND
jgi:AcrR family transcriptional regulator